MKEIKVAIDHVSLLDIFDYANMVRAAVVEQKLKSSVKTSLMQALIDDGLTGRRSKIHNYYRAYVSRIETFTGKKPIEIIGETRGRRKRDGLHDPKEEGGSESGDDLKPRPGANAGERDRLF